MTQKGLRMIAKRIRRSSLPPLALIPVLAVLAWARHWAFDKTEGIAQGRRVADYVFANAFAPLPRTRSR